MTGRGVTGLVWHGAAPLCGRSTGGALTVPRLGFAAALWNKKRRLGTRGVALWIVPLPSRNRSAVNTVLRVAGTFHVLAKIA